MERGPMGIGFIGISMRPSSKARVGEKRWEVAASMDPSMWLSLVTSLGLQWPSESENDGCGGGAVDRDCAGHV
ncbi:hypothetical protein GUJ93_ZPchr0006g41910 [Zizania palustris]|uniref:Uncharacterized protein n=1 Tax=Zizania palustris TaxID=103762 RepID=A0A8J5TGM1_ZIZPA|nr:hypothetical protein GUJ93_ZPchr0006g41910 [Zizania palustris]